MLRTSFFVSTKDKRILNDGKQIEDAVTHSQVDDWMGAHLSSCPKCVQNRLINLTGTSAAQHCQSLADYPNIFKLYHALPQQYMYACCLFILYIIYLSKKAKFK